uniref:Uncharacterized protein n=1 Tax=Setaria italica TaxID=4555 RepID=K4APJ6_SETIT
MRFGWHCDCACGVTWSALLAGCDAPIGNASFVGRILQGRTK